MYIKFCKSEHNLAKECSTISLGTLHSYANDDPDFMKFDYREGKFTVSNFGSEVTLKEEQINAISQGRVIGTGIKMAKDSNFTSKYKFPNCYIYCFGNSIPATLENAKKFDPLYDSWFSIKEPQKFSYQVVKLLNEQLKLEDLQLNEDTYINDLKDLAIQIISKPVEYLDKDFHLRQNSINQIRQIVENPIDWTFQKDKKYKPLPEYRIVFVIVDKFGNQIPVKSKNKILNLLPDLGVE